jgi:hypothetical protein
MISIRKLTKETKNEKNNIDSSFYIFYHKYTTG